MQPKHPILQKCINKLEALPHLHATLEAEIFATPDALADGILVIQGPEYSTEYICEIKTNLNIESVEQVIKYLINLRSRLSGPQKPLLVTQRLSNQVVNRLIEEDIEFVDGDGSLYINSKSAYILVRNQNIKEIVKKSYEITAATLQVMYAVLQNPNSLLTDSDSYERLTRVAGVDRKTFKKSIEKLQRLDYLKKNRNHGGYEIADYIGLFERWEMGYSERLRNKLLIERFSPLNEQPFSELEYAIREYSSELNYQIGGELGAALLTRHITPIEATLHVPQDSYRLIAVKLKLKPNPNGKITFLQCFGDWRCQTDLPGSLADPLLIHAELLQSDDDRLRETAQLIYDKYIEEIAREYA
jgi:hypothetical protein